MEVWWRFCYFSPKIKRAIIYTETRRKLPIKIVAYIISTIALNASMGLLFSDYYFSSSNCQPDPWRQLEWFGPTSFDKPMSDFWGSGIAHGDICIPRLKKHWIADRYELQLDSDLNEWQYTWVLFEWSIYIYTHDQHIDRIVTVSPRSGMLK